MFVISCPNYDYATFVIKAVQTIPSLKTGLTTYQFKMLKIYPFKILSYTVFVIVFFVYEGSAPPSIEYDGSLQCQREIENYFPGSEVIDRARHAMVYYTKETNFMRTPFAKHYYKLIEQFLDEESILSVVDFCIGRTDRSQCQFIVSNGFTDTKKGALRRALYRTNKYYMDSYLGTTLESQMDYFYSILNDFRLTDGFPGPVDFCNPVPLISNNEETEELRDEQIEDYDSMEEDASYSSLSAEQLSEIFTINLGR